MNTIQPDGEMIRKAVKWISEERQADPSQKQRKLVEEAAVRFNLSPMEAESLEHLLKAEK